MAVAAHTLAESLEGHRKVERHNPVEPLLYCNQWVEPAGYRNLAEHTRLVQAGAEHIRAEHSLPGHWVTVVAAHKQPDQQEVSEPEVVHSWGHNQKVVESHNQVGKWPLHNLAE